LPSVDGAETPARVHYFHNDQIGLPRELSDKDGRIAWRASYRAWGNTLVVEHPEPDPVRAEPAHQPLRFQGQYFDAETGLHYNCFRYCDPDVGQFVASVACGAVRAGRGLCQPRHDRAHLKGWVIRCFHLRSETDPATLSPDRFDIGTPSQRRVIARRVPIAV
jgi:RHS repeat-associated protein